MPWPVRWIHAVAGLASLFCNAVDLLRRRSGDRPPRAREYPSGFPRSGGGARLRAHARAEEMERIFRAATAECCASSRGCAEGMSWHMGDAADPALAASLGPQSIVVGPSQLLCHLQPAAAARVPARRGAAGHVRRLALLTFSPGYADLDMPGARRCAAARPRPASDSLEELHEGDPSLRASWPAKYWGLEPIDKTRPDWKIRYASVFQVP